MADVTWSATDSGNVLDTQGNIVGTADGAGTFSITTNVAVGTSSGSTSDTLTIESGITVEMAATKKFIVYAYVGNLVYGTLIADGVTFTSAEVSPAAGDWAGITYLGNTAAASPSLCQRVYLTSCTIEYVTTCVSSQNAAGLVANKFVASGCTFQKFNTAALDNQAAWGYDSSGVESFPKWEIYNCIFSADNTMPSPSNVVQCLTGGTGDRSDKRAYIKLDHCSFLIKVNSAFDVDVLRVGNYSSVSVNNCVVVGANAGAGDLGMANISATFPALPADYNFWLTDVDGTGGSYQYSPNTNDQNVDPSYLDDTTYPFDLSPDAQAGTPDLYIADEFGSFPGAVEPYNYPTADTPDPTGTAGVWAGRKQRVYESGFGTDASKTLGRAIRVKVSSSDVFGEKLIGGILMKINPERLK